MKLPPGVIVPKSNVVCRLQRSLYGLRQAGRQWYAKLSLFLLNNGYVLSVADHSLFLKTHANHITAFLVYVDDIVLTGNNPEEITNITTLLHQNFQIKNLGDLTFSWVWKWPTTTLESTSHNGNTPWIFYMTQGCLSAPLFQHLWSTLHLYPVLKVLHFLLKSPLHTAY